MKNITTLIEETDAFYEKGYKRTDELVSKFIKELEQKIVNEIKSNPNTCYMREYYNLKHTPSIHRDYVTQQIKKY